MTSDIRLLSHAFAGERMLEDIKGLKGATARMRHCPRVQLEPDHD
jgi:hypothetical protein